MTRKNVAAAAGDRRPPYTPIGPTIILVPVEDLIPYARNARTHSDAQVAQLAGSLVEFGWTNPAIIADNGLLAGHGRVLAARKVWDAGQEIPCPSEEDPGAVLPRGMVPCVDVSYLDDAQRRAYVLADNKLALNAGWDFDLLKVELADLQSVDGFEITLTGFSEDEISNLLADPAADDLDAAAREHGEMTDRDMWPSIEIKVPPEVHERFGSLMSAAGDGEAHVKVDRILSCVDVTALAAGDWPLLDRAADDAADDAAAAEPAAA